MTRTRYRPPSHDEVALMCEIVRGTTSLPGAACKGLHRLYDPDIRAAELGYPNEQRRWNAVTATCTACPVRATCWAWASGLSSDRVVGPTAASQANPFSMRRNGTRG